MTTYDETLTCWECGRHHDPSDRNAFAMIRCLSCGFAFEAFNDGDDDGGASCCCPLVWDGSARDPKPDPRRVDPDCPVHAPSDT